MKKIWFIAHDNHIDHRIISFVKIAKACGYDPIVFPSDKLDFTNEEEYIVRPWTLKYELDAQITIDSLAIELLPHDEIRNLISTFSTTKDFKEYYKNKRTNYSTFIEKINDRLYLSIFDKANNIFYGYMAGDTKVSIVMLHDNEYISTLKELFFDISAISPKNIAELESKIQNWKKNISFDNIECIYNENKIRLLNKGYRQPFYELDLKRKIISYFEPFNQQNLNDFKFLGESYNLLNFRQIIYDFTHILSAIENYLEYNNGQFNKNKLPEIVYVADLPTLPIGIMLKEKFKIKLVVDCHEHWGGQSRLWEPKLTKKIEVIDKFEKELYPLCDIRLTVGKTLAEYFKQKFDVKFNAIFTTSDHLINNENQMDESVENIRNIYNLPKKAKILMFQGSLTRLRNLETMVRAANYLVDDQYLVIIGHGELYEEMISIAKSLKDPKKVIFLGWVEQNKLLSYTKQADLGIIPYIALDEYYSMSLPNKLSEYYAASLPVLCDKSMQEISSILNEDQVGLSLDCSNPTILGKNISALLANSDKINQMKKQYTNSNRFSWLRFSNDVKEIMFR